MHDAKADPQPQQGLGKKMAAGAVWVVGFRIAVRLLGVASTIILARLLTPEDFGIVAIASLISASLETLGSFNFQVWLIQHPKPDREHYDTVWTLTAIRGAVTAGLMALFAVPLALFFAEPRLSDVLPALAIGQLLIGLQNIGIVDFHKQLQFRPEFWMLVLTKTGSFIVTVALALALRSYWAMVAGIVAGQALNFALSYVFHPYRPRLSLAQRKPAFDFSKWVLAGNLAGFAYLRIDLFVIGKLLNPAAVGLYALAREIADLATTELAMPIRRVMLPGYAKLNQDPAALRQSFEEGFHMILLIGAPCALGIGLVADPLVRVALGEQWLGAIDLVRVLSVYAFSAIIAANQGPMFLAIGKTRQMAWLTIAAAAALAPTLLWAVSRWGTLGAATAVSVVNLAGICVSLLVLLRLLEVRLGRILGPAVPTMLAALAMAISVRLAAGWVRHQAASPAVELIVAVGIGAVAYPLACAALWRLRGLPDGPERKIYELVVSTLRNRGLRNGSKST